MGKEHDDGLLSSSCVSLAKTRFKPPFPPWCDLCGRRRTPQTQKKERRETNKMYFSIMRSKDDLSLAFPCLLVSSSHKNNLPALLPSRVFVWTCQEHSVVHFFVLLLDDFGFGPFGWHNLCVGGRSLPLAWACSDIEPQASGRAGGPCVFDGKRQGAC